MSRPLMQRSRLSQDADRPVAHPSVADACKKKRAPTRRTAPGGFPNRKTPPRRTRAATTVLQSNRVPPVHGHLAGCPSSMGSTVHGGTAHSPTAFQYMLYTAARGPARHATGRLSTARALPGQPIGAALCIKDTRGRPRGGPLVAVGHTTTSGCRGRLAATAPHARPCGLTKPLARWFLAVWRGAAAGP